MNNSEHFLFVEKYRPRNIEDCILPLQVKNTFRGYKGKGRIPNLLLFGTPGSGKTTVARALCNEVNADHILINASNESGIDTFRNKVVQFASTISLTESKKVIILDEFDHATPQMQAAMRAGLEEVSANCTFIFTCNYKDRIIPALHSRCSVIDFKIPSTEKIELAGQFFKRVISVLKQEHIEYDQKVVAELVQKYFPDYRRVLNEIQQYSVTGKIDTGILAVADRHAFKELFKILKAKNFTEMRQWVAKNIDADSQHIFRSLFDYADDFLDQKSIPSLILILDDYQDKATRVGDLEINMAACMVEIMAECSFK